MVEDIIYTDEMKFLKEKSNSDFIDVSSNWKTMQEVYDKVKSTIGTTLTLEQFIGEIGQRVIRDGEGQCRPRYPTDKLSGSTYRGRYQFSEWLQEQNIDKNSYEKIMAYTNNGFLLKQFRDYKPG